jgi:arylsulfatase A-like enzyme
LVIKTKVAANIDLAPTLLDACGLTTNWLRDGGKRLLDGRSLLPLVAPHHARFAPGKEVHPEVWHGTREKPITTSVDIHNYKECFSCHGCK